MIDDYTVLDLEMTGLTPKKDKIIEIGAVKVRNGQVIDTLETLVNPGREIPYQVTELTGITNEMVCNAMDMDEAVKKLLDFIGEDIIVGHNIIFDYSFVKQWAINHKISVDMKACDTLKIARKLLPADQSKRLENLCEYFNISRENAHRALDDALETNEIFIKLKELIPENKLEDILTPYPLIYKAKKQSPITKHQLLKLQEYMGKHEINDPIDLKSLTRSEASRLYDQYRSQYGK